MSVRISIFERLTRTLGVGASISSRGKVRVRVTKRLPGGARITLSEPVIRGRRRR